MRISAVRLVGGVLLAACSRGGGSGTAGGEVASKGSGADSSGADSAAATPVTMASVERRTLAITVSGPGQIDALEDERVRAPFNGTLVSLRVKLGDHVRQGESVGEVIAQNSEAALLGARAMLRSAATPVQRQDAERALALAEQNLVRTPLPAPKAGVVIARPASPGELVAEGDSIISIGATNSMAFFATLAQSDLARIRTGEPASISLASGGSPLRGVVKRVLPSDTGSTGGMRVEIDLVPSSSQVTIGLFGTARITVDEHRSVPVVPKSALLRDDVNGTTKIALVTPQNEAQWIDVTPGISDSAWAEIISPPLRIGQRVITTGQVGLPDSTRVVAMADTAGAQGAAVNGGGGGAGAAGGAPNGTGAGGVAPGSTGPGNGGGGGEAAVRPPANGSGAAPNGSPNAPAAGAAAGGAPGGSAPRATVRPGNRSGSPAAATTHAPAAHTPTPGAPATGGSRRPDDE